MATPDPAPYDRAATLEGIAPGLPFALFDHLPDTYCFVKDAGHRFVSVNAALWRLHGCRGEHEMLGRADADFHPPILAAQYVEEDRRVMAAGEPLTDQLWLVPGGDAVPRWYLSTKLPLRDRRGRVIGIAGVMRACQRAGGMPPQYRRLAPALELVRTRYAQRIAIGELAAAAGMSISQLQREFQHLLRLTPRAYVLRVRLAMAQRLLEHTSLPLGTIALDTGFCDQSHFTRRFLALNGVQPRRYRERFQGRR